MVTIMKGGVGDLAGGRYRLVEELGRGGMGRVWRARDQRLKRDVAIKEILLPDGLSQAEQKAAIKRMMREAQVAANLQHHGIIAVYDVLEEDGVPWIVMEFVKGPSLASTVVLAGGSLPWRQAATIGRAMAEALAHAHERGVVHRDIKPDNVLQAKDRTVIADFGIARLIDSSSQLTALGMQIGTLSYMSPEQFNGDAVEPPSDMWSLGVTLYAAVEGRLPFDQSNIAALCAAIREKPPRPTQRSGPLAAVIEKLLTKDPDSRPTAQATARLLADIIEHGANSTRIIPDPGSAREKPTRLAPEVHERPARTLVDSGNAERIATKRAPSTRLTQFSHPNPKRRRRRNLYIILLGEVICMLLPLPLIGLQRSFFPAIFWMTLLPWLVFSAIRFPPAATSERLIISPWGIKVEIDHLRRRAEFNIPWRYVDSVFTFNFSQPVGGGNRGRAIVAALHAGTPTIKLYPTSGKFDKNALKFIKRKNSPPGCLVLTSLEVVQAEPRSIHQAMLAAGVGHLYGG